MLNYPPQIKAAAKNLLDNEDFRVLINTRIAELREDIEESLEEKQILLAHSELNNIKAFGQWIEHIGEDNLKRQAT